MLSLSHLQNHTTLKLIGATMKALESLSHLQNHTTLKPQIQV